MNPKIRAIPDFVRLVFPSFSQRTPTSVVQLVPSLAWGGAERLACTTHRLAQRAGWSSTIEAPSTAPLREGIAQEIGSSPWNFPNENTLTTWAHGARKRLQTLRPSVVHAHLPFPDRLGAVLLASAGFPLVVTFQLLPDPSRWWPVDELLGHQSHNLFPWLSRLPRSTRFVVPSRADVTRLSQWIPEKKLFCIPNAPPLSRIAPPPAKPSPWPNEGVRLLSAGRLVPQKGYDRMLEALAHESLRALSWHWVLAGTGSEEASLRARAEAVGLSSRISFAPAHTAEELYPHAQLLLAPSRFEGMPLVPPEAVEAGVPVLLSSIPAHIEQFGAVPETILPTDETQWPSVLRSLLVDHAQRTTLYKQQRAHLPSDLRAEFWQSYERLYRN